MNLNKTAYSKSETELFNYYLSKVLTDKNLNLKKRNPAFINFIVYKNKLRNGKNIEIRWDLEDSHYYLYIGINNEKIEYITFSFNYKTRNLHSKFIELPDKYIDTENIKLLMELFYKYTDINCNQYTYNYNK